MKVLKGLLGVLVGAIALLVGYLYWLGTFPSHINALPHSETTQANNWSQALANAKTVDYKLLQVGRIVMDRNTLMQGAPDAYAQRFSALPVLSHWIRHPKYGEFLVDAGFSKSFQQSNDGNYNWLMRNMVSLSGIKNSLEIPLELHLNHKVDQIEGVLITHFHPDHSSGISDLPAGTAVIADRREYDFLAKLTNTELFSGQYDWQAIDFEQGKTLTPFERVVDVFGDGSVWAVSTPGHTQGHTSYLLNTADGVKFIVGDASHFRYAFDNNYPPAALSDELREQAAMSLAAIKTFASQHPEVKLVFGHQLP